MELIHSGERLEKLASDIRLSLIAALLTLALSTVSVILVARILGPADFGVYKLVMSVSGLIYLLFGMNISSSVVKFTSTSPDDDLRNRTILAMAMVIVVILGMLGFLLAVSLAPFLGDAFRMKEFSILLLLMGTSFVPALVLDVLLGFLNGRRSMRFYLALSVFVSLTQFVPALFLLLSGTRILGLVLGISIANWVLASVAMTRIRAPLRQVLKTSEFRDFRPFLSFGAQLNVSNVVNWVMYQLDLVLIGLFLTSPDVGYYGVAIATSRYLWILPQAIQRIVFPAISELRSKSEMGEAKAIIESAFRITCVTLAPVGLLLATFGNNIVQFLFGSEFMLAAGTLVLLLPGTVIFGVLTSVVGALPAMNRPDLTAKLSIAGAVLSGSLNIVLIPTIGVAGAAITSSLSLAVASILGFIYIRKEIGPFVRKDWGCSFAKISLAAMMLVVLILLVHSGSFLILAVIGVYATVLLLRSLDKRDHRLLSLMLRPKNHDRV